MSAARLARGSAAVALVAIAAACSQVGDPQAVRAQIEARNAELERAYAAGDAATVAAAFAADAWQMPPNHAPLVGRPAIEAYWKSLLGLGRVQFSLKTQQVAVHGPLAVERGHYVLKFTAGAHAPPGLASFEDSGNYLVQWRHEPDGSWRAVADAPVSERPAPGGAAQ